VDHGISHDEQKKRFVCQVDGMECSVDYETNETAPGILDVYRTFVHPDLRGKGIAESLLKSISEYAVSKGFSIQPSCSYAVLYYRRHPKHAAVLVKDIDLENGGSCRLK
jgi:predicted GNAT family acetyltransferase